MTVEIDVIERIRSLIEEAQSLKLGNAHRQVRSVDHSDRCYGWITAATNIVQQVVTDSSNAYRKMAEGFLNNTGGACINQTVGEFSAILENLDKDIELGLLTSVADQARAETFDNFLEQAKDYHKKGMTRESGVIAGVVFEDSIRRVCSKNGIDEAGRKLDDLISDLAKFDIISHVKAKRARAAAGVRTKATHAQWDDFDAKDVQVTIEFSEELIVNHLDK